MSTPICLIPLFILPGWFLLLVVGVLVWAIASTLAKQSAGYDTSAQEPPLPKADDVAVSKISRVVDSHADCTAEVLKMTVSGRRKSEASKELQLGDMVILQLNDGGEVRVQLTDNLYGLLDDVSDSRIPSLLSAGHYIEAYLGGREMSFYYSDSLDVVYIIVFYKIDGVPPTKVNLQT